jgi:hypothetical protein
MPTRHKKAQLVTVIPVTTSDTYKNNEHTPTQHQRCPRKPRPNTRRLTHPTTRDRRTHSPHDPRSPRPRTTPDRPQRPRHQIGRTSDGLTRAGLAGRHRRRALRVARHEQAIAEPAVTAGPELRRIASPSAGSRPRAYRRVDTRPTACCAKASRSTTTRPHARLPGRRNPRPAALERRRNARGAGNGPLLAATSPCDRSGLGNGGDGDPASSFSLQAYRRVSPARGGRRSPHRGEPTEELLGRAGEVRADEPVKRRVAGQAARSRPVQTVIAAATRSCPP